MATRIADPGLIEQRLLDLAFTSDAKITAPALAFFAPTSIENAQRVLDKLTAEDRIRMEIEDDGTVVYHVPARARIESHALVPQTPPEAPHALMALDRGHSPAIAAVLAALFPGAGHLYAGRIGAALGWFFAISIGYVLVFPGLLLHAISVVSAAYATVPRAHYQLTA